MLRHRLGWQKPIRGTPLNRSHPLARGLLGYWVMNEGTGEKICSAVRSVDEGQLHSTATPDWVSTEKGMGLEFTRTSNDRVFIESKDHLTKSLPQLTVGAWAKQTGYAGNHNDIFSYWDYAAGYKNWLLTFHNSNKFFFELYNPVPTGQYITSSQSVVLNTWYFVVGVYNGVDLRIYIDGVLDPATPVAQTGNVNNLKVSEVNPYIMIGSQDDVANTLEGQIACTFMYGRALTPAEIAWLYREPYCMFYPVSHARLVDPSVTDYYDSDGWVSFRVYQGPV